MGKGSSWSSWIRRRKMRRKRGRWERRQTGWERKRRRRRRWERRFRMWREEEEELGR